MGKNTRIYKKWQGYSSSDCECKYCLYKTKSGCSLKECCCAEEKLQALKQTDTDHLAAESMVCA